MQPKSKNSEPLIFCSFWIPVFVYNMDYVFDCRAYLDVMHDDFSYFRLMIFK